MNNNDCSSKFLLEISNENPLSHISLESKKYLSPKNNNISNRTLSHIEDEELDFYEINNINIFDKDNSLNLNKYEKNFIYQQPNRDIMCSTNYNISQKKKYSMEFIFDPKSSIEINYSKEIRFSKDFSDKINQEFIEKTRSSIETISFNKENSCISQTSSISHSISFSSEEQINNILNVMNSINNNSFLSSCSDKENLIKFPIIINENDYNKKGEFKLEYELGFNTLNFNDMINNNIELPLNLTLNNYYCTKINKISIDLIIILNINEIKNESILTKRKYVLSIFEYILSEINDIDRISIIQTGSIENSNGLFIVQNFETITKTMKKIILEFINSLSFSNKSVNIFQALKLSLNILHSRDYKNDFTNILIISDYIFDCNNLSIKNYIEKESRNLNDIIKNYKFHEDSFFNINSIYCGDNALESLFLANLCSKYNGDFFRVCKLSYLKKCLLILTNNMRSITLYDITLFIKINCIFIKNIKSTNCFLQEINNRENFKIEIPSMKFNDRKQILILLNLTNDININNMQKNQILNLMNVQVIANKFNKFDNILDNKFSIDKLFTNPLDITIICTDNSLITYILSVFHNYYRSLLSELFNYLAKNMIENKKKLEEIKDEFEKNELVIRITNVIANENGNNKFHNFLKFYQEIIHKAYRLYERNNLKNIDYLLIMSRSLKNEENNIYIKRKKFMKELKVKTNKISFLFNKK